MFVWLTDYVLSPLLRETKTAGMKSDQYRKIVPEKLEHFSDYYCRGAVELVFEEVSHIGETLLGDVNGY